MTPILQCNGLSKAYGGYLALNNINLTFNRGRIIGLLGPNGSGKSTFLKLLNGLLVPSSGSILINGMQPGVETKSVVSYLPERTYLPDDLTISSIVDFFNDFYSDFDRNKAAEMLTRLNLNPTSTLKTLSKGSREKVQLILVMSRNAELYCLDEPIGGVDPAARDYILNTILANYNRNATILISTHLIQDIENILDDAIFIQNGNIRLYAPAEQIRQQEGKSIDAYFREVFRC